MTNAAPNEATPQAAQPSNATPTKPGETARAGTLEWRRDKARLRLSLGAFGRRMLVLSTCRTEADAEERRALLVRLADMLVASGQIALGFPLLQKAAEREGRVLDATVQAIERVSKGEARARPTGETTIRQIGEQWTSGELTPRYPGHVKVKKTAGDDARLFERYVYPLIGALPVASFTLDHADRVMAEVPSDLASATRRHVAQVLHKLIGYAVFPLRLLPASPFAKGWLPCIEKTKAKSYLYPDEDRRLLACRAVPLAVRMLYGFLAREGMRSWSEAAKLEWSDLDLTRGVLTLDTNKTDDPRAWALRPDVCRALVKWRAMRPDSSLVFGSEVIERHPAERFRERLCIAGIDRPQLFEQNAERLRICIHDLRATFITIALANGRTEAWISDRTGHKSSLMIHRYKRPARTVEETQLGDLAPLDLAIPELAAPDGPPPSSTPPTGSGPSEGATPCDPVSPADPGTGLVHVARAVASGHQNTGNHSDSRRAMTVDRHLKSAAGNSVSVRARPGLLSEDHRGFETGPATATDPHAEAVYQIRTNRAS
jgi:integrase